MLNNCPLQYPNARNWMWNYCVYLGPFNHKGENYDLGVYVDNISDEGISAAIVYGNEPGDYMAGDFWKLTDSPNSPMYQETYRRSKVLGLTKP